MNDLGPLHALPLYRRAPRPGEQPVGGVLPPGLSDSWVAFIDELGAKQRYAQLDDEQLADDLELTKRARVALGDYADTPGLSTTFSDNIVINGPVVVIPLRHILETIARYQLLHIIAGRFLRGALVRGKLYSEPGFVTGPGLVHAAQLEKNRAIYPRILVDDAAARDPNTTPATQSEVDVIAPYLDIDQDGFRFVNYLRASEAIIAGASHQEALVKAHGEEVINATNRAVEAAFGNHVLDKYRWTFAYHNGYCKSAGLDDLAIEWPASTERFKHEN